MVLVNNRNIPKYDLDDVKSFTQRIAASLDTIPEFLYFPEQKGKLATPIPDELKVEDLTQKLQGKLTDNLVQKLRSVDKLEKGLLLWLANRRGNEKDYSRKVLEEKKLSTSDEFKRLWRQRNGELENLEDEISQNKLISRNKTQKYSVLQGIVGWKVSDIEIDKVKLEIRLLVQNTSILELFNKSILSEKIPFVQAKNYYKILRNFIPSEDWVNYKKDKINEEMTLKVSDKEVVDTSKFQDYKNVKIRMEDGDLLVNMDVHVLQGKGMLKDKFIKRSLNVFQIPDIKYDNEEEFEVSGVFYYDNKRIDPYVLSDLIMNDEIFSYFLVSDESLKATKKASEHSIPSLYVHYKDGYPEEHVSASIIQRTAPLSGIRNLTSKQPYIRVRAKGKNRKVLNNFRKTFSKLLKLYDRKKRSIIDIYQKYIPGFGVFEEKKESRSATLRNMDPDVFVQNYSRQCEKKKTPQIVTDEKNIPPEAMKFPRDKPNRGKIYPSDGVNQHYYICSSKKYPFPGLQKNNLSNSDNYPYLPCCFSAPQTNSKYWKHYYEGKEIKDSYKHQQALIKTNKILGPRVPGELVPKLTELFKLIDPNPLYSYVRWGMIRNHSSFLAAAATGMWKKTGILNIRSYEGRKKYVNDLRQKFATPSIISLCRQCAYDVPADIIMKNIKDENVYFDPKLYVQLVEDYLDCNIFLFNSEGLIIPRHIQGYYTNERINKPCIFIFEHMGSESDNAKYPQCELITRWNTSDEHDNQYTFPYVQKISRNIRGLFAHINTSYVLSDKIQPSQLFLKSPMHSQVIDTYGKCRCINVEYKSRIISILVSPIAPRRARAATMKKYKPVPQDLIRKFLKYEKATVIAQGIDNGELKSIVCRFGNVEGHIPTEGKSLDNIPIVSVRKELQYVQKSKSKINRYNKNKKFARYITEYTYWLFSKFMNEEKVDDITDKVLDEFSKKKIKIIPDFKYKNIRKTFSENGSVVKNGKLIVTSKEFLKRLMYTLKLYSVRNYQSLLTYHNREVIQEYYKDMTDFDEHPNQVVLQGSESVEKWIGQFTGESPYTLYNKVRLGIRNPYFFRNRLISEDVYLAQNAESLEQAMSIGKVWNKKDYNISARAGKSKVVDFVLYSYVSPYNITRYRVKTKKKEKGSRKNMSILGYKNRGKLTYTVLLPV